MLSVVLSAGLSPTGKKTASATLGGRAAAGHVPRPGRQAWRQHRPATRRARAHREGRLCVPLDAYLISMGLRWGFGLGVDVTHLRGRRTFRNYESAEAHLGWNVRDLLVPSWE